MSKWKSSINPENYWFTLPGSGRSSGPIRNLVLLYFLSEKLLRFEAFSIQVKRVATQTLTPDSRGTDLGNNDIFVNLLDIWSRCVDVCRLWTVVSQQRQTEVKLPVCKTQWWRWNYCDGTAPGQISILFPWIEDSSSGVSSHINYTIHKVTPARMLSSLGYGPTTKWAKERRTRGQTFADLQRQTLCFCRCPSWTDPGAVCPQTQTCRTYSFSEAPVLTPSRSCCSRGFLFLPVNMTVPHIPAMKDLNSTREVEIPKLLRYVHGRLSGCSFHIFHELFMCTQVFERDSLFHIRPGPEPPSCLWVEGWPASSVYSWVPQAWLCSALFMLLPSSNCSTLSALSSLVFKSFAALMTLTCRGVR